MPEKRGQRAADQASAKSVDWPDLLRAILGLLWFVFAVVGFCVLFPLAKTLLTTGAVDKVHIGIVEVELASVPAQKPPDMTQAIGDAYIISPEERKRISDRFVQLNKQAQGARLLWVDDEHPYQNVRERRVLLAAGIAVDLARSTDEALQWLYRSSYDVLITDASRPNDTPAPCQSPTMSNAGCALLRTIGDCFNLKGTDQGCLYMRGQPDAKAPKMIVYASGYRPELGLPPYAFGMTNYASTLFDLVLNALALRQVP
ncbi:MAG: hypothetical protein WAL71_10510 [Terriglobales bacterium]|jgi:hypothetical protein